MKAEQKQEKVRLIKEAGRCLKDGRTIRECKSNRLKNMMGKIAANAVLIMLCEVNHTIVSNICDGDFDSVQDYQEKILDKFSTCLAIINRKGDGIDDLLSVEEIDSAIKYTIYEQTDRRVFRDEDKTD